MKSHFLVRLIFVFATFSFGALALHAQDPGLKARIEQRLGSVNALKDRGVVGETNRGFLEARDAATADDQRIIGEENTDRRAVYAAIAARTNASADQVGQKRAEQIASLARAGHWIQDAGGAWKKK